jgi:hypothetical protein
MASAPLKKSATLAYRTEIEVVIDGVFMDYNNPTELQLKKLSRVYQRVWNKLHPKDKKLKSLSRVESYHRQLKIVNLRRLGWTYQKIADAVNCTKQYAGYVCKQYAGTQEK